MSEQPANFDDYPAHGDKRTFGIPFCNYGPLLVLKLNAFAQRTTLKQAKDAYDILSLATLETQFTEANQLGPMLAESFYHGPRTSKESSMRLREDLVTIAHALLNA